MSWRRRLAAGLLAAAIGFVSGGATADRLRFPKPDRPVARIISPAYSTEEARDRQGEAARVMDRLAVKPGLRVADLGAGDGYYTVRLARRLGAGATVYAEDVEARYLERLRAAPQRIVELADRRLVHAILLVHDASGLRAPGAIAHHAGDHDAGDQRQGPTRWIAASKPSRSATAPASSAPTA